MWKHLQPHPKCLIQLQLLKWRVFSPKHFFLSATEYPTVSVSNTQKHFFSFFYHFSSCVTFLFLVGYALERCKKEIYRKEYKEAFPLAAASGVTEWNAMRNMCAWNMWKFSSKINNYGGSRIRILWYILDICISADTLGINSILSQQNSMNQSSG